jgi:uncharacterized protein YkwD
MSDIKHMAMPVRIFLCLLCLAQAGCLFIPIPLPSSGSGGDAAPYADEALGRQRTLEYRRANPPDPVFADWRREVVAMVNKEREKDGQTPVREDAILSGAADERAGELIVSFSHTRPDGEQWNAILPLYGIGGMGSGGENISMGSSPAVAGPQETMARWMNSSGHRANILDPSFSRIGIGIARTGESIYWVQLFLGP